MLYEREKQLMGLLDALGGSMPALDFQKLLFLFCREAEEIPSYSFVPYRFGAFSFTSYADKRRLIAAGLLEEDDRTWQLTEAGRLAVRKLSGKPGGLSLFLQRHAQLRGNALIEETYRRYPYYAIRSEMLGRLRLDADALRRIGAARPPLTGNGLLTIGYEGRNLEEYLNLLIRDGVNVLCDVRRNPLSRKYGFAKNTLGNACQNVGIRYEHLPELGIPSQERRGLETQADYKALFASYCRDSLPMQTEALAKIQDWIDRGERVALTCYEKLPEQCHRHCVAEAVQSKSHNLHGVKHL
jgi:hypothetical protein